MDVQTVYDKSRAADVTPNARENDLVESYG